MILAFPNVHPLDQSIVNSFKSHLFQIVTPPLTRAF